MYTALPGINYPELNIALTLYLTFNVINAFGWINTPLQKSVMLFSVIMVFFMCRMRPVQPGICQSGQPPRILWRRIQIWYKHLRCPRAVDHLFSVPYVSLLPPLKRILKNLPLHEVVFVHAAIPPITVMICRTI